MGRVIGIDLGTTNTVVSTVDYGCRILQNRENEQQTVSVVTSKKGEILVGTVALNRYKLYPKNTIRAIKRLMGRAITDSDVKKVKEKEAYSIIEPTNGTKDSVHVILDNKEFSPIDISSFILKKVKDDAEFTLNEDVTHAVITVPAYFSDKQRYATREAGLKAGLKVMKIIDEPTAAAIAYGIDSGDQEAKTILVFDLGGGTFDISILMMSAGAFATLNLEGDMWLGGEDFTNIIVEYIMKKIEEAYGVKPPKDHKFYAAAKTEAEAAKKTLSSSKSAEVIIPVPIIDDDGDEIYPEFEITRDQFQVLVKPLIDRIVTLVKKAVKNAKLDMDDIDSVLMAGNASCMPIVHEMMQELFGNEKMLRKIHPKQCVAMGAAMTAAVFKGITCPSCNHFNNDMDASACENCGTSLEAVIKKKICPKCSVENDNDAENCKACGSCFLDIGTGRLQGNAPFSYGIQTVGDKYHVFIKKNDQVPTSEDKIKVQTFYVSYPNQRIVSIPVYGGDNLEKASSNEKQGEAAAFLPPRCAKDTAVRIKLWLDQDGAFDLQAQLEEGLPLYSRILRGESDQKAVKKINDLNGQIIQKGNDLTSQANNEMEKEFEKAVEKYKEDQWDKAIDQVDIVEKALEEKLIVPISSSEIQNAQGMLVYGELVARYDWLINKNDLFDLTEKIATLRNLLDKIKNKGFKCPECQKMNNKEYKNCIFCGASIDILKSKEYKTLAEADSNLEEIVNRILRRNLEVSGFIGMHISIISRIMPQDPSLGSNLEEELNDITQDVKKNTYGSVEKLKKFIDKLKSILSDLDGGTDYNEIKCHECGHGNKIGSVTCANCHASLIMLKDTKSNSNTWGGMK